MFLALIVSNLLVLFGYWLVCRKDGSYLNWMTPKVALGIPSLFILPYLYTVTFGDSGSLYANVYCFGCYTLEMLLPALAYRWMKFPSFGWGGDRPMIRWAHWITLALAQIIYAPVLLEYKDHIFDPRYIYMATRRGYGLTYFGSSVLLNVAAVLFFFRKKKNRASGWLFWLIVAASTVEHGSKGQLMIFLWIWMLFRIYIDKRPFRFLESARLLLISSAVLVASFVVFGIAQPTEIIEGLSKYADYTRNAARVIDDPDRPTYFGALAIENALYSRIPRAIFPGKPTVFGVFRLTMRYFEASDWEDVGSPDFGIGVPYADFGPFAILYVGAFALFSGGAAKCLIRKLRTDPNPANLLLLAFFSGMPLIPLGIGYALPETVLLSWIVLMLLRFPTIRIISPRRLTVLEDAPEGLVMR